MISPVKARGDQRSRKIGSIGYWDSRLLLFVMIFPMVGGAVQGFDLLGKRSLVTLMRPSRYVGTPRGKDSGPLPGFLQDF
jgi:hypothetical protein